jgi:hypothetical protein
MDWSAARECWNHVRRAEPTDLGAHLLYLKALRRSGQPAEARSALIEIENLFHDADLRLERDRSEFCATAFDTLRRFESLGSGCEFGMLQRETGFEPLGLMRWTSVTPDGLIRALRTRFSGIGDPIQTTLISDGDEYWLDDSAYSMRMHTFISTKEDREKVFANLCRRLTLLSRKLIEDLENAEKVFVFNWSDEAVPAASEEDIHGIYDAIQSYGPNKLLFVSKAANGNAPGDVVREGTRLMRGFVHHGNPFDGVQDSDFKSWNAICSRASEM